MVTSPASMKNLLQGFDSDWRPMVIVLMGIVIGLNVSFILKKMNNVVKVFAAAAHAPIEVLVAHFVLKTRLTWTIAVAAGLIIVAILLFRLSPKLVTLLPWLKCTCCCPKIMKCCKEPRGKSSTTASRLLCCCKLSAAQKLTELEAALDDAREEGETNRRRASSETDLLSTPTDAMSKIRAHEEKHGMFKTYYWSLDDLDISVDEWSASNDYQTVSV